MFSYIFYKYLNWKLELQQNNYANRVQLCVDANDQKPIALLLFIVCNTIYLEESEANLR